MIFVVPGYKFILCYQEAQAVSQQPWRVLTSDLQVSAAADAITKLLALSRERERERKRLLFENRSALYFCNFIFVTAYKIYIF